MVTAIAPSTKAVGFWSAVLATVFSLTYVGRGAGGCDTMARMARRQGLGLVRIVCAP